jgi:hypothetical protein
VTPQIRQPDRQYPFETLSQCLRFFPVVGRTNGYRLRTQKSGCLRESAAMFLKIAAQGMGQTFRRAIEPLSRACEHLVGPW